MNLIKIFTPLLILAQVSSCIHSQKTHVSDQEKVPKAGAFHRMASYGWLENCTYPVPKNRLKYDEAQRLKSLHSGNKSAVPIAVTSPQDIWEYDVLHVYFYNGANPLFITKILKTLKMWEACCPIRFVQAKTIQESDIRVSFTSNSGCHSYIGTDARNYPNESTLNLDPTMVDETIADSIIALFVLHEFGHAMGFVHEHQRADVDMPWEPSLVYKYYACMDNWDSSAVYDNIFYKYKVVQGLSSKYDTLSIMHYDFPAFLTSDCSGYSVHCYLSENDKKTANFIYGKPQA